MSIGLVATVFLSSLIVNFRNTITVHLSIPVLCSVFEKRKTNGRKEYEGNAVDHQWILSWYRRRAEDRDWSLRKRSKPDSKGTERCKCLVLGCLNLFYYYLWLCVLQRKDELDQLDKKETSLDRQKGDLLIKKGKLEAEIQVSCLCNLSFDFLS